MDIRLIVASGTNLEEAVGEGAFRSDLYYRINTVAIELPDLRERAADIQLFVQHFLDKYNHKYQKKATISRKQVLRLEDYSWPGNIRQLQHSMERAIIMSDGDLTAEDIIPADNKPDDTDDLYMVEKQKIAEVISRYEGNISKAAKELGIGRNTLYRKMKKYEL
ncbi:MAG: helix-turn-helix domain-containing protein [Bacteroidota bacterium]